MKTLTTGSWYSRIYFATLMLVCFSMPFAVKLNSIALIACGCATIAWYLFEGRRSIIIDKRILILAVYYCLCFIGFALSEETRRVWSDLEQKIPIVALPLILAFGPSVDDEDRIVFQNIFVVAVLIVCVMIIPAGLELGFRSDALFEEFGTVRRPYLGMYCVAGSFFCIEAAIRSSNQLWRIVFVVAALFLAVFPVVILAKMAVVAMPLLIVMSVFWFLITKRKFKIMGALIGIFIIGASYFFLVNEKGKDIAHRIATFTEFDWNTYDVQLVNSVNLRFINWSCSVESIFKDDVWLTGAGTGDSQVLLNECYAGKTSQDSFLVVDNYNSHNQFFTTWLNLGLAGFLWLVFLFLFILILFGKKQKWIPFTFTAAIILFCLTESIFEVQKGIVLYSFFQSLFFKIYDR